jgi:hypothetical protein
LPVATAGRLSTSHGSPSPAAALASSRPARSSLCQRVRVRRIPASLAWRVWKVDVNQRQTASRNTGLLAARRSLIESSMMPMSKRRPAIAPPTPADLKMPLRPSTSNRSALRRPSASVVRQSRVSGNTPQ